MSKAVLYALVIGLTYATLDKGVFKAGVGYTADQLGDHLDDTNEEGDAYFEEVGEEDVVAKENPQTNEIKVTKKSVTINKKAAAPAEGGDGKVGNVDQTDHHHQGSYSVVPPGRYGYQ